MPPYKTRENILEKVLTKRKYSRIIKDVRRKKSRVHQQNSQKLAKVKAVLENFHLSNIILDYFLTNVNTKKIIFSL